MTGLLAEPSPTHAFRAGRAVLIIAWPCELSPTNPAALVAACGRWATLGIFVKGSAARDVRLDITT